MVYWSRRKAWQQSAEMKQLRRKMINQTNSFLDWALSNGHDLPRIPRRRVDKGGFGGIFKKPGGKRLIEDWWQRVFKADWPF